MTSFVAHRNGQPATTDDLGPLAFAGYAHFTAMQVRDGLSVGSTSISTGCGPPLSNCSVRRYPTNECEHCCAQRSRSDPLITR